ncbi:MAG: tetratricopeptide repeat protein [Desulfuromonadales bacterium]
MVSVVEGGNKLTMDGLSGQSSDFSAHANWVAEQNRQFMLLDFSPASILTLDTFISEMWGESGAEPETEEWHPSDGKWNTILNFGIYFGEFLIRRYNGEWVPYEPQPESLLNIAVVFPNGMKVFPVAKVWKRFKNGVEDSISPLYRWIRGQLNDEPGTEEWREWFDHGNRFMRVKRPDHAIPFFRHALACPLPEGARNSIETALQSAQEQNAAISEQRNEPAEANVAAPVTPLSPPEPDRRTVLVAQARNLLADRNHDGVLDCLRVALQEYPDDPELNELLGDQLASRKDIPGAMRAFEKGTGRWESAHSWEGLGICRNLTGDREGAIAAWQEAAHRDAKRAMPCFRAGTAEEQCGNKLKALEWYRQAAERAPADEKLQVKLSERIAALENDPEQLRQQADRFADQGDTAGAVAVYEKIVALNPRDTEAWRESGVGYAMLKQFDKALECLDKAIKSENSSDMAWDFKAVTLARMGKNPVGLSVIDEGLTYCLNSARLWARRAYLLNTLNRYQEGLTSAAKALELDPDYGSALLYKFDAERQLGRTAEALESISRHIAWVHPGDHRKGIESMKLKWELENPGLQLDPQQAAEQQEYAFHYWQSGSTEQSLAAFKQATELDPFSYEIWNNYGSTLNGLGRYEEAIACFDRAHQLYPLITDFLKNKAASLVRMFRNQEALECHEKVLARSPKDEASLGERARLLSILERHDEALQASEVFAAAFPGRGDAHVRHCWALRKLDRTDDALAAIERAIALRPDDRNLWLHKSVILGDLGRDDEAEELQVRAFEDKEFAERYHQEGLELFRKFGV